MIDRSYIKNAIYFDIETVGLYPTLEDVKKNDPHLAELWEKKCKWLVKNLEPDESTDPSELWVKKASLYPEFGKIVCISFGVWEDESCSIEKIVSFYNDDEKNILENCNKILANSRKKQYRLAGHNIKNFDIPFLGKRMLINSINPDLMIQVWNKKPWEVSFFDLAEIFSFGAWVQSFTPLELISHVLGVENSKDTLDGSKIHSYFWDLKNYEEIKNYCEKDVMCIMNCFKKISYYFVDFFVVK